MWASAFHSHSLCSWAWRQQGTRTLLGGALGLARERPASLLTGNSIFNLCHICEVGSVGDAQAPHAMSMTPFLEEKQRDHVKHGQLRQLSLRSTTDPTPAQGSTSAVGDRHKADNAKQGCAVSGL